MDCYSVRAFPHFTQRSRKFTAYIPWAQLPAHSELLPTFVRKNERHLWEEAVPSLRLCDLWPWLSLVWSSKGHERAHCCKSKIYNGDLELDEAEVSLRPLQVSAVEA